MYTLVCSGGICRASEEGGKKMQWPKGLHARPRMLCQQMWRSQVPRAWRKVLIVYSMLLCYLWKWHMWQTVGWKVYQWGRLRIWPMVREGQMLSKPHRRRLLLMRHTTGEIGLLHLFASDFGRLHSVERASFSGLWISFHSGYIVFIYF
jgi:hypothetical protein